MWTRTIVTWHIQSPEGPRKVELALHIKDASIFPPSGLTVKSNMERTTSQWHTWLTRWKQQKAVLKIHTRSYLKGCLKTCLLCNPDCFIANSLWLQVLLQNLKKATHQSCWRCDLDERAIEEYNVDWYNFTYDNFRAEKACRWDLSCSKWLHYR